MKVNIGDIMIPKMREYNYLLFKKNCLVISVIMWAY